MSRDQVLAAVMLTQHSVKGSNCTLLCLGLGASRTTCIQQEDELRAAFIECGGLYTEGTSHTESRVHESYR